jgi:hypothetical protein
MWETAAHWGGQPVSERSDIPSISGIAQAALSESTSQLIKAHEVRGTAVQHNRSDDFPPLIFARIVRDVRSGKQVVDL